MGMKRNKDVEVAALCPGGHSRVKFCSLYAPVCDLSKIRVYFPFLFWTEVTLLQRFLHTRLLGSATAKQQGETVTSNVLLEGGHLLSLRRGIHC